MASIKIETTITITDEQSKEKKFTVTKTISSLTSIEERDYAIAADATSVIWDTSGGENAMTDFDFFLAWSDGNMDLEFGAGSSNDVKRLVADLPLMLGADDTVGGTGIFGQVADLIDKIRSDEPSSVARKLKIIMAT